MSTLVAIWDAVCGSSSWSPIQEVASDMSCSPSISQSAADPMVWYMRQLSVKRQSWDLMLAPCLSSNPIVLEFDHESMVRHKAQQGLWKVQDGHVHLLSFVDCCQQVLGDEQLSFAGPLRSKSMLQVWQDVIWCYTSDSVFLTQLLGWNMPWFNHSFIHSFVHSFSPSITLSASQSVTHSPIYWFIYWITQPIPSITNTMLIWDVKLYPISQKWSNYPSFSSVVSESSIDYHWMSQSVSQLASQHPVSHPFTH